MTEKDLVQTVYGNFSSSNTTCYDFSNFEAGPPNMIINMSQVLGYYNDQFILKLWYFGFLYLFFVVTMMVFIESRYGVLVEADPKYEWFYRGLKFFVYLNFAPALYLPVLLIGLETGWYQ